MLYKINSVMYAFSFQEQTKHADKQLMYQCQCSFLEVNLTGPGRFHGETKTILAVV